MPFTPAELRRYPKEIDRIMDLCDSVQSSFETEIDVPYLDWAREAVSIYNKSRQAPARKVFLVPTTMRRAILTIKKPGTKSLRGLIGDMLFHLKPGDSVVIKNEWDDIEFESKVRSYVSTYAKQENRRFSVRMDEGDAVVSVPEMLLRRTVIESLNAMVVACHLPITAVNENEVRELIAKTHSDLLQWFEKNKPGEGMI